MADYTLSAKITGDSSGFSKALSTAQKAADNLQKKIPNIFKGASKQASKSLSEIAAESGKTVDEIRSDVMKAAAEYEKAGMTKSEAMKKAYADIGYSAESASQKSKIALGNTEDALDGVTQKAISAGDRIKSIGDKFAGIGEKISSVGSSLTSKITKPALAAGTALAGITVAKGWNRLTGIDDARAKLQGLGHDAQTIETIMDSALTSVKGTSFGLDEAATTAANAVAAGIKPGQELTKYLSMTADAAAIAGISMAEMGSIINKVQTGQTVYTEDLEQLADRGLPVYQWLAEEAGVAASEVKQLASDGQISAQMLYNAIEKNIGGAAQIIGETSFTAALDNIGASISRIGANFLDAGGEGGGFFSQLKPLMADFSDQLAVLEEKASELGVKFGAAFANVVQKAQELKARFDSLPESVQSLIVKAAGIGAAVAVGIGPALKIVGTMMTGFGAVAKVIAAIISPIGLVVTAVAGLAAGFTYLMKTNESFRAVVMSIWDAISAKIQDVKDLVSGIDFGGIFDSLVEQVKSFTPAIESIFGTLKVIGSTLLDAFSGFFSGLESGFSGGLSSASGFGSGFLTILGIISPALKMILLLFQNFGPQIMELASMVGSNLVPVFTTLGTTIGGIASAVMPAIMSAITNLLPVIMQIISTVMNLVSTILPVLTSLINQLAPILVDIVGVIGDVFAELSPMISKLVSTLLPVLENIVTVIMNVVKSVMPAVISIINVVMSIIQAIAPIIMNILSVVISVISNIISTISPIISFIGMVISAIMAVITPIVTFIANIIATIIQVIGTIIGTVTDIFATVYSVVSGVWGNITDFISTAINGISSVISSLTGIVGGVFNSIYSTVSSVMGNVQSFISGVFTGIQSAWNGLTGFVSGIFDGISSAVQSLVSSVTGFINGVIGGINSAIDLINNLPGVEIGAIPYLAHGTDNWTGGFAYMNESGRGELTYLPNGSQVIPHDISVKYAKESARANAASAEPFDVTALGEYIVSAMAEYGNRQGQALEKGISNMGVYFERRPFGRVIADMGFARG